MGCIAYPTNTAIIAPTNPSIQATKDAMLAITLVINNGTANETYSIEVQRGTSAYELFGSHADLKVKEYGGLGAYILEVNGLPENKDGNGKFWQYYVDGEYAKVGVSHYKIEKPATVELRYEKPNPEAYK